MLFFVLKKIIKQQYSLFLCHINFNVSVHNFRDKSLFYIPHQPRKYMSLYPIHVSCWYAKGIITTIIRDSVIMF